MRPRPDRAPGIGDITAQRGHYPRVMRGSYHREVPLTGEQWRRLARSSPWRWSTLRFVNRWNGPSPAGVPAVRAWLRRPGLLRVERLDEVARAWERQAASPHRKLLIAMDRSSL